MNSHQIRESFLSFFEAHQHTRFKSASLIPANDPTLFFTNAGMVPFKEVFTGREKIHTKRAVSSQKCLRVSGKHNDLENVGRTPRHHTFFEMLGNFSLGDYFKAEAIELAWKYLVDELKIDPQRLWITIFKDDQEAGELWQKIAHVPKERIVPMGEKDNFWSMGPTGPCGPCSEIHYDFGEAYGKAYQPGQEEFDDNRYMEIWNLVFMQYDREASGKLNPLPKPSVDTGMGLERLSAVLQGKHSNYDSDLFVPLIKEVEQLSGKTYGADPKQDVSMRVLADHSRAATFLIGDGVLPSNEGRGYVLRRILRRGLRHGQLLGLQEAFFFKLAASVIKQMQGPYPELKENQSFVLEVIQAEEERFLETLEKGLSLLNQEISRLKQSKKSTITGELVFKLYDTFGFPLDLSQNIAEEAGLKVDEAGFKQLMEAQKNQARAAWKGSGETEIKAIHQALAKRLGETPFLGYETLETPSQITALLKDGVEVKELKAGDRGEVFTQASPFYAESGGQVGDQGELFDKNNFAQVEDTQSPAGKLISHQVIVKKGFFKLWQTVQLKVTQQHRSPTRLNHTATHLLHAALRKVLGDHVKQAGSLVDPERLRFDFSHFKALSPQEKIEIENLVNAKIREDLEVKKEILSYDQAMKKGAMALFGEKYGDQVRVLSIGDFSTELCGGTHVDRTGEIALFKILSESSVASGVRRIEAITGAKALQYTQGLEAKLNVIALSLKSTPEEVLEKLKKQNQELKKAQEEIRQLKLKLASSGPGKSEDPLSQVQEISGVKVLSLRRDLEDIKSLRDFSDQLMDKLKSGVLALGAAVDGKATLIVRVSKDLNDRFQAGKIIQNLAPIIGAKGGGKPTMAQAGGGQVEKLEEALKKLKEVL